LPRTKIAESAINTPRFSMLGSNPTNRPPDGAVIVGHGQVRP
jgi:hypothetical protein